MIERIVPSAWLDKGGRRLDCGPYLSGAIEAKVALDALSVPKEPLVQVVRGGEAGVFHAGREARTWVDEPAYGAPFLSSSDVLAADLSRVPLIAKKQVAATPQFILRAGWTLITRSGTIGRMVYCRGEMDGYACSEHVMRVVPDTAKIASGYLYAFLSGRYGLPLVIGGTYGSIIQSIEPEHLFQIPVPRFGDAESRIHKKIQSAADNRSLARIKLNEAERCFYRDLKLTPPEKLKSSLRFAAFNVPSTALLRLDAHFYSPACTQATKELAEAHKKRLPLGEIAGVFTPGIFKRIHVSDPKYGHPYYSGSELFELMPGPRGLLSKKSRNIEDYIVRKNWLLIQDAGQLGGLIGQVTRVRPPADKAVVSNHLMRVVPHDDLDVPYVYLVLNSRHGHLAILRHAFGTSIPQLDPAQVKEGVVIPWPDQHDRRALGKPVLEAWALIDEADRLEASAIADVERMVAEGQ